MNRILIILLRTPSHIGLNGSDEVATKILKLTNTTRVPALDLEIYYIKTKYSLKMENRTAKPNHKQTATGKNTSPHSNRHEEIVITCF